MLTTLAFDSVEQSLFRQLLDPITFTTPIPDTYLSSQLTDHLVALHNGGAFNGYYSDTISSTILDHQLANNLSSDWITDGSFMADIDTSALFAVSDLSYTAIGGAWLYFTDTRYAWATIQSSVPLESVPSFVVEDGTSVYIDFSYADNAVFTINDYVNIHSVAFINVVNPTPRTLNINGLTQVSPSFYTANPIFVKNNTSNWQPQSSSFSRSYYLDADSFDVGSDGLFNEGDVASNTTVANAVAHKNDASVHVAMDDFKLSTGSTLTSRFMRYALTPNYFLGNGFGGDAWFDQNNDLQFPAIDNPVTVTWIAYHNANPGEAAKYVRHPTTNEVIAKAVNNKTEMRCSFELPLGVTPVADAGIVLRRLNPTQGYSQYTALYPE